MKSLAIPIISIIALVLFFYFISNFQKKSEVKKDVKVEEKIKENDAVIVRDKKDIAKIEELNKLLAQCQQTEQKLRAQKEKVRTQIIKVIDEKVSNNPNPTDTQLDREIAELANLIREARRLDSIAR